MEWLAYRLVYRADSPIHVGYHKLGMIQLTRRYIHGKLVWASATARLTRALWDAPGWMEYEIVGKWMRRNLCFTYLFPTLSLSFPLIPCYSNEGLRYGFPNMPECLSSEDFEHKFIGSYASTAMNASTGSAEEGSLHEIEYLSHRAKDTGQQVMYTGAVFLRQSAFSFQSHPALRAIRCDDDVSLAVNGRLVRLFGDVLHQLMVGGEICYGFGRLSLLNKLSGWFENSTQLWNRYPLSLATSNGSQPQLEICIGTLPFPVPGHLEVMNLRENQGLRIQGVIEPLSGREWDHTNGLGAGRVVNSRGVYSVPGTVLENTELTQSVQLKIDYDGVLFSVAPCQAEIDTLEPKK